MASWKMRWMLPFLLLSAGVARAQETFSAGDSQPLSDTFSTSCIQNLKPNIWKQLGVNPLTCHPQSMAQDSQGQCTLKGATQVAHQGTMCYYCVPQVPPGTLYIPMDQVEVASKQGYLCGESPVDPGCMVVCSKEFSTTTTYVPPPPQTVPPPLQNGQATNDPCHPYYNMSTAAGRAAMQANAARDAAVCNGERCAHNPELDVCKIEVKGGPQAQSIPGMKIPPPCAEDTRQDFAGWTGPPMLTLIQAVDNARQMLQTAQTATSKKQWDPATLNMAKLWYGNTSPATQQTIRNNISGALLLIKSMQTPNDNFFVGNAQELKPDQKDAIAYVRSSLENETSPTIFLLPPFWSMPATGNDSQATTVVHELSHYKLGGGTDDVNYGEGACQYQVYADPFLPILGVVNLAALTTVRIGAVALPPGVDNTLGKGQSLMLKWATGTASITNADSFKYFVYYVSHPEQKPTKP
jgi:hypothetical protein